jgi:transcriptional regulator with XRE-family HTH domain
MDTHLKQYRRAHGLTQADVAGYLGLSVNRYAIIERGEGQVLPRYLDALAGKYGVEVTDLIADDRSTNHTSQLMARVSATEIDDQLLTLIDMVLTMDTWERGELLAKAALIKRDH